LPPEGPGRSLIREIYVLKVILNSLKSGRPIITISRVMRTLSGVKSPRGKSEIEVVSIRGIFERLERVDEVRETPSRDGFSLKTLSAGDWSMTSSYRQITCTAGNPSQDLDLTWHFSIAIIKTSQFKSYDI
jgi:hypothetical protein